jgi:hypothetical protein
MNSGSSASISGVGCRHRVVVPDIAPVLHRHLVAGDPGDEHRVHVRAALERLVGVDLEGYRAAATTALVGGDHHLAVGVEDAVLQCVGGEATEHDRVDRADACAGEHRHGDLGDHRHVDRDPVALLDAACLERIGELADFGVQFAVGDLFVDVGVVTLPDDRDLVAARLEVAVQAVDADVELAPLEPADVRLVVVVVEDAVPRLRPGQELLGLLGPETLRVVHRALVHLLVLRIVDQCVAGEIGGYVVDLGLTHVVTLPYVRTGVP